MLLVVLIFILGSLFSPAFGAPQKARVTSLPGFKGSFSSNHYAGYITVDQSAGRQLYYYFVTSERTPKVDPVVLWLNGGPGCSSFDGFVYEHGPFLFQPGDNLTDMPTLTINPYSWAKVANIIYLESPAGVGFSYSNTTSDYVTGDLKTADDSHTFLLKFFQLYPEFLSNPFYVAGESYAGVYVPTLAQNVASGIERGLKPVLNLKGYLVGNGVTDEVFDGNALVSFAHGMGLISNDLYQEASQACGGNYWNASSSACVSALDSISADLSKLNLYNILEPCYHNPDSADFANAKLPVSLKLLGKTERRLPVRKRMFGRAWPLGLPVKKGYVPNWHELLDVSSVPCLDFHVATIWLNNPAVRQALHALPMASIGKWEICTDKISYFHDAGSMLPFHLNLTKMNYRALIYSGDHDMCVPFTGSQAWTDSLGYKVQAEWSSWIVDDQVAGYFVSYDHNLTFATVKGAGHTVPEYKPKEALALFERWLTGSSLRT